MSTESKLKIVDTDKELNLSLIPESFLMSKGFQYDTDFCLAQERPKVNFKSGGEKTLSVRVKFDEDVDDSVKIDDVIEFFKEADKVQSKTDSVSPVEFRMGSFSFVGFILNYSMRPTRFSSSLSITGMDVDLALIESSEEENE